MVETSRDCTEVDVGAFSLKKKIRPFFSFFISLVVQLGWLLRLNMIFNLLGTPTEAWYEVSLDRSGSEDDDFEPPRS